MKSIVITIVSLIFMITILSSCSTSNFSVSKRRYNDGFYVDFNKKNKHIGEEYPNISPNKIYYKDIRFEEPDIAEPTFEASKDEVNLNLLITNKENHKPIIKNKENKPIVKKSPLSKKIKSVDNPPIDVGKTAQTYAIISFVLGLLGVITYFTAIPAIVFGIMSLKRYKLSGTSRLKWMAILGLVLGIVFTLLIIVVVFYLYLLLVALA
ncbi:MAG TPA: hypothetical protein DDX39_11215 [Bacteroidales bacterium]|nr:MAG: hypothetical protein A2W98_13810 [Bacteroidetes bacterium GWF2_33_38]OFY90985.1 MAG: hypothetical protein A2236_03445 [Bacteroidetes bacterium RIFOXYA2_FULL_33_7]HBF89201.1 hypothetical protein [Bacteroidales bacterium]